MSQTDQRLCYIIRGPRGENHDLGCQSTKGIAPNGSVQFSLSRLFDKPGTYRAFFALYDGSRWHEGVALPGLTGKEVASLSFTILSNPTLTQGLTLSNANPRAGEPVTATFKLKNFSNQPVTTTEHNCFILRSQSGANHDFGCLSPATIQPNQELEFKATRSFPAGTYSAYFSTFDGRHWQDHKAPPLETGQEAVRGEMRVRE